MVKWVDGLKRRTGIPVALMIAGTSASAALGQTSEPRFCPNRPSLGSSACTTAPGQVQIEVTGVDWQHDRDPAQSRDSVIAGDALVRLGLGPATEVQVAWTAFGAERSRDRLTGGLERFSGVGDVTLALRQNLQAPDGKGLSFGIQPFVTLPVGKAPIGAGDWAMGVLVPITYDLGETTNLQFTAEADAAVDEDGSGRHLAYRGIVGLSQEIGDRFTINGEVMFERDNDPAGHENRAFAAASIAWHPEKTWQVDLLAVAGLNRDAADLRLALGGAMLFR